MSLVVPSPLAPKSNTLTLSRSLVCTVVATAPVPAGRYVTNEDAMPDNVAMPIFTTSILLVPSGGAVLNVNTWPLTVQLPVCWYTPLM